MCRVVLTLWLGLLIAIACGIVDECDAQDCVGTYNDLLEKSQWPGKGNLDRRLLHCHCTMYQFNPAPLPQHLQGAAPLIDAAIQTWRALYPNVLKVDWGLDANCSQSEITYVMGSSVNISWPFGTDERGQTLQIFNATGYMIGFEMYFNFDELGTSPPSRWTTAAQPPSGTVHLQTIALHEAGHVFGLDDVGLIYVFCPTVMKPYLGGAIRTC